MMISNGQQHDLLCVSPVLLRSGHYLTQRQQSSPREPIRWTRGRLEAAIAARGGPEGLDLAGADLSYLDLQGIDLYLGFVPGKDLDVAGNVAELNLAVSGELFRPLEPFLVSLLHDIRGDRRCHQGQHGETDECDHCSLERFHCDSPLTSNPGEKPGINFWGFPNALTGVSHVLYIFFATIK